MPSRWMSADGLPKPIHTAPAYPEALLLEGPAQIPAAPRTAAGENGRIAIIVHDSLYSTLSQSITEFTWDLAAKGYSTVVYRYVSGSAESLRTYLAGLYGEPAGLKGAVLIGEIPYIIYEMMQEWSGPPEYDDFPCDIFYMDLNGVWSDSLSDDQVQPGNGKYDTRSGDLALEIWVGRIRTANLPSLGAEASLINSYLAKNHAFRARTQVTDLRATVYDDDDWANMATDDANSLAGVFGSGAVTAYGAPEATTGMDFKSNRLPYSTRWYLVRSHGWPGGHGFYRLSRQYFDYVYCSDYRAIDPPASFFSLFVCSGVDYTASDYLGGTVAFNPQSAALFALGSTKTGGMWGDSLFYGPMAEQKCIGESFRIWFNQVQVMYDSIAPQWWYGMAMIGDPSLHPYDATPPTYYPLTISVSPPGAGTVVPSAGNHTYPAGQILPLVAAPAFGYLFDHWNGPVADPYSAETTLTLDSAQSITAVFMLGTAARAKLMGNGGSISLTSKVVTYAAPDFFYVEEDTRESGIRVDKAGHGLAVGARASVGGTVETNPDGERYIAASSVGGSGSGSVGPLGMNNRAVGGADWNYDSASGKGQQGVTRGQGLNNIGLLVKIRGKVESVDLGSRTFVVTDGSVVCDSNPPEFKPFKVTVVCPGDVTPPGVGLYVTVTGVCSRSREDVTGEAMPLIRVRTGADIQ